MESPQEWLNWFGVKPKHTARIIELYKKYNIPLEVILTLTAQQKLLVDGLGYNKFCSYILGYNIENDSFSTPLIFEIWLMNNTKGMYDSPNARTNSCLSKA